MLYRSFDFLLWSRDLLRSIDVCCIFRPTLEAWYPAGSSRHQCCLSLVPEVFHVSANCQGFDNVAQVLIG
jgi:hypothetical protein